MMYSRARQGKQTPKLVEQGVIHDAKPVMPPVISPIKKRDISSSRIQRRVIDSMSEMSSRSRQSSSRSQMGKRTPAAPLQRVRLYLRS